MPTGRPANPISRCPDCGKEYQRMNNVQRRCKTCAGIRQKATAKAYKQRYKLLHPRPKTIRFCQKCGKEYTPIIYQQKYCEDCRNKPRQKPFRFPIPKIYHKPKVKIPLPQRIIKPKEKDVDQLATELDREFEVPTTTERRKCANCGARLAPEWLGSLCLHCREKLQVKVKVPKPRQPKKSNFITHLCAYCNSIFEPNPLTSTEFCSPECRDSYNQELKMRLLNHPELAMSPEELEEMEAEIENYVGEVMEPRKPTPLKYQYRAKSLKQELAELEEKRRLKNQNV